jgi:hypothetical protein
VYKGCRPLIFINRDGQIGDLVGGYITPLEGGGNGELGFSTWFRTGPCMSPPSAGRASFWPTRRIPAVGTTSPTPLLFSRPWSSPASWTLSFVETDCYGTDYRARQSRNSLPLLGTEISLAHALSRDKSACPPVRTSRASRVRRLGELTRGAGW